MRRLLTLAALLTAGAANQAYSAPNILLILADDMGVEALSVYGIGESAPTTATIDSLARDGVLFRNFWSQPVCSPTRATIMTGRYGFRTGVGRPIAPAADGGGSGPLPPPPAKLAGAPWEPPGMGRNPGNPVSRGLPASEFMLPMALAAGANKTYRTAAIGKWHLADPDNGWLDHPRNAGIDFYSVIMHGEDSYFAWRKNLNGEIVGTTIHSAVDQTETAVDWIAGQGDEPWFMWLSFILPHTPLHLPPTELLQSDYSDLSPTQDTAENPIRYFHAMIEAMDTEIGRVLDSMTPAVRANTYVIFIGDNGTTNNSVIAPFERGRAKATVYQGGVNVPLIVSGPGVEQGAVSEALVNSTDLFATVLEMAEADIDDAVPEDIALDSVSIMPYLANPAMASIRGWVYADVFPGSFLGIENANYAMRNDRYKVLRHEGSEEFYDLIADPYEHSDLLHRRMTPSEQRQYDLLQAQIQALRESR
jgi:arylsulfatase A-like enzyme